MGRTSMNLWVALCLAVGVYGMIFLQASSESVRQWLGAQVDFIPGLMVYLALGHAPRVIILTAVVAGALHDSLTAGPMGISILPLALVGSAVHLNKTLILREQRYAQIILGMTASAAVPAFSVILLHLAGEHPLLGWGSLWQWAVMTAVGGFATPLWFFLFGRIERALSHPAIPEATLREDRQIERGRH